MGSELKMGLGKCAVIASVFAASVAASDIVTCGSSVRLQHIDTKFHVHSHEVAWGSGSRQQSVTAHKSEADRNSLWLVTEGSSATPCVVGEPMKCGSVVRLKHGSTSKHLHSHLFKAPLSGNQEVSAYGGAEHPSDSGTSGPAQETAEKKRLRGDDWTVECQDSSRDSSKQWMAN